VGDQQMLEYTQGGSGARFELLVLHDDAAREYAYGPRWVCPAPNSGLSRQHFTKRRRRRVGRSSA
jgi:hypothetical protein